MAVALAYPESKQGKKNKETSVLNTEVSDSYLKHARFVLRNCRDKAEQVLRVIHSLSYPQFAADLFACPVDNFAGAIHVARELALQPHPTRGRNGLAVRNPHF